MRLFTAIIPSSSILAGAGELSSELRRGGIRGNYTDPANIHITLAFIGEYPDPKKVLAAMRSVRFEPYGLSLKGSGHFGDLIWAGIGSGGELADHAERLRQAFDRYGIPYDRKPFSPHITILRRASAVPGIIPEPPEASMTVRSIVLMRSDRVRSGMVYTPVGRADSGSGATGG